MSCYLSDCIWFIYSAFWTAVNQIIMKYFKLCHVPQLKQMMVMSQLETSVMTRMAGTGSERNVLPRPVDLSQQDVDDLQGNIQ